MCGGAALPQAAGVAAKFDLLLTLLRVALAWSGCRQRPSLSSMDSSWTVCPCFASVLGAGRMRGGGGFRIKVLEGRSRGSGCGSASSVFLLGCFFASEGLWCWGAMKTKLGVDEKQQAFGDQGCRMGQAQWLQEQLG